MDNLFPKRLLTVILSTMALSSSPAIAAIQFEETTGAAGITRTTQTFGITWADINNDDRPDVYLSNHWLQPSLYLNTEPGAFVDVADQHELADGHVDEHGAAFADYDEDGDKDLIVVTGGTDSDGEGPPMTSVFRQEFGSLVFLDALDTGLTYGYSDRTPIWLDENLDGLLDVIIANEPLKHPENSSVLFRQTTPGQFQETLQFPDAGRFACLLPNMATRVPDLAFGNGQYFRKEITGWQDVSDTVYPNTWGRLTSDCAVGDINGDGHFDLYMIRDGLITQFRQTDLSVQAAYQSIPDEMAGIDFQGSGTLTVYFGLSINRHRIRLGAGLAEPPGTGVFSDPITVSSSDPQLIGEPEFLIDSDAVILWIWYTPADSTWHFRTANTGIRRQIELDINSNTSVGPATHFGIELVQGGQRNLLYLGDGAGGLLADSPVSDISIVGQSRSGVFADFDNDMDLDLYLVNYNRFDNLPNQLFENLGGGSFTEVPNAGGAVGSTEGSGQSVAVADYDLDGFVDFFVANGKSDLAIPNYPGPHQLFRNLGNTNHWLQIDLVGTTSTLDAVGALVEVVANGVTQTRFQDGGMHAYSQNFPRLHFGLADQLQADSLTVHWPNGIVQTIGPVAADQILTIVEPPDVDGDGVADEADNCLNVENPDQRDVDGDGIGSLCDPDLDQSCSVNFTDLSLMQSVFFTNDPVADFTGDGTVNFLDLEIMKDLFFLNPGPSGALNDCD